MEEEFKIHLKWDADLKKQSGFNISMRVFLCDCVGGCVDMYNLIFF